MLLAVPQRAIAPPWALRAQEPMGDLGNRHVVIVMQTAGLLPAVFPDHEGLLQVSGIKVELLIFTWFVPCNGAPRRVERGGELSMTTGWKLCMTMTFTGAGRKLVWVMEGGRHFRNHRGWVLGAAAAIANDLYVATAVAVVPSKVAKLDADEFLRLLETDRSLSSHIHGMHARECAPASPNWGTSRSRRRPDCDGFHHAQLPAMCG